MAAASSEKPKCKYGSKCYRKNKAHQEEYSHASDSSNETVAKGIKIMFANSLCDNYLTMFILFHMHYYIIEYFVFQTVPSDLLNFSGNDVYTDSEIFINTKFRNHLHSFNLSLLWNKIEYYIILKE